MKTAFGLWINFLKIFILLRLPLNFEFLYIGEVFTIVGILRYFFVRVSLIELRRVYIKKISLGARINFFKRNFDFRLHISKCLS